MEEQKKDTNIQLPYRSQVDLKKSEIKDNDLLFVLKKSEKVSSAIYLLTNFYDEKEPLKWAMRKSVVDLVKDITDLRQVAMSERDMLVGKVVVLIGEILSYLEVSYMAGFLSEMNHEIFKREIASLLSFLKQSESTKLSSRNFSLSEEAFSIGSEFSLEMNNRVQDSSLTQGTHLQVANQTQSTSSEKIVVNHKRHSEPVKLSTTFKPLPKTSVFMANVSNKKDETTGAKPSNLTEEIKSSRQEIIVSLLRRKSNLMIKDFAGVIRGCSEKTIQRELMDLIRKGAIKREGDRRWSTYSLSK